MSALGFIIGIPQGYVGVGGQLTVTRFQLRLVLIDGGAAAVDMIPPLDVCQSFGILLNDLATGFEKTLEFFYFIRS